MNVLEYTEQELNSLSKEELLILLDEAESGETLFNTQQMSAKLQINSLYGALGNAYFPLFNQDIARAITGNGRYFIARLGRDLNKSLSVLLGEEFQFTISGDTDSVYFKVDEFVNRAFKDKEATVHEKTDWVDNFLKTNVEPIVQKCIADFSKDLNAFDPGEIGASREVIADKGVLTAKKKYFLRVIDSEGVRYNPFKMKVMGLEIARSSTPSFIKSALKEHALGLLLDGTKDEIQNWMQDNKVKFCSQPLETICKASGVSRIDYDLSGNITVPMNSRASIVYNNYIKNNNLEDKYSIIEPEDKVRIAYLVSPNPFNSNVVAFIDPSFIEGFRECIDFDLNFDKYFKSPLEIMAAPLGYDLSRTTATLDDW